MVRSFVVCILSSLLLLATLDAREPDSRCNRLGEAIGPRLRVSRFLSCGRLRCVVREQNVADLAAESAAGVPAVAASGVNTYYREIPVASSGSELKASLHVLIRGHRQYSYGELWDKLAITDRDPQNSGNVVLLYTGWSYSAGNHGGKPNQWNREHVWAKSRGDFGTKPGAGTDLHHIRPSNVSINAKRGNLAFDEGGDLYNDPNGPTVNRYDQDSWEPRDEVKGDVARMLFYMDVRYEESDLDLELVDEVPPPTSKAPTHGKLSVLLKWHKIDPPSPIEIERNQRIFELQGNRNPFIDHPEWVERIWERN